MMGYMIVPLELYGESVSNCMYPVFRAVLVEGRILIVVRMGMKLLDREMPRMLSPFARSHLGESSER